MSTSIFKTFLNFTRNIKTTGAIFETSARVENEICSKIGPHSKLVIEYGTGYGNLTAKILERLPKDGKLIAFEVNEDFVAAVKAKFNDPRLTVVKHSAVELPAYIDQPIQNIVSSIPFTLIPKEEGDAIIQQSHDHMADGGYFSQVLYSKFHLKRFKKHFSKCEVKVVPNIPIEHVYHCLK
ncbi:MAG: methyltransferase domain-containing protein [Saprospiraceae bacterium]|nr:methyltransferase domain-containing protein [Saprospiraceae bacterium]